MARKRKRSATNKASERVEKRLKFAVRLGDLPVEILDTILSYVVPDARDIRMSVDCKSTAKMYTTPISQTSRFFRQQCFSVIDRRTVWIRIKFHGPHRLWHREDVLETVPILPHTFRYLLREGLPTVSFELDDPGMASRRRTRSTDKNSYMFPFNMSHLLNVCYLLNGLARDFMFYKITLRYDDMSDFAWKQLPLFIVPAMSELQYFQDCEIVPEPEGFDSERYPCGLIHLPYNVADIWEMVNEALQRADRMDSFGFYDEAGVFLLFSDWLVTESLPLLPAPEDWVLGELDHRLPVFQDNPVRYPGRCPRGNELRRMLFEMEHRACLAYVRFLTIYGPEWCIEHKWDLQLDNIWRSKQRFLDQPDFTWFGLTEEHFAQLHFDRAMLCEALGRCEAVKLDNAAPFGYVAKHYNIDPTCLEFALTEIYIAQRLKPDDLSIQTQWDHIKTLLRQEVGSLKLSSLEVLSARRFVDVVVGGASTGLPGLRWRGDLRIIVNWGQENYHYLPLAQKLPELTPDQEQEQYLDEHPEVREDIRKIRELIHGPES